MKKEKKEAIMFYLIALLVVILSTLFMINRCEKIDEKNELSLKVNKVSIVQKIGK